MELEGKSDEFVRGYLAYHNEYMLNLQEVFNIESRSFKLLEQMNEFLLDFGTINGKNLIEELKERGY